MLTDKEKKTITMLLEKGRLSGYDFHLGGTKKRGNREAIMSSSHWLKMKESLEKKHLIKYVEPKKGELEMSDRRRRKRRKDLYDLTLRGVVLALAFIEEKELMTVEDLAHPRIRTIDKIAERHADKFRVFQEWKKLKRYGAREEIFKNLRRGRQLGFLGLNEFQLIALSCRKEAEMKKKVDDLLLGVDLDELFLELKGIFEAVKNNPTLKRYVEARFTEDLEIFREGKRTCEQILDKLRL